MLAVPSLGWATAGTMQDDARALLRRSSEQQQVIAQLDQRLQAGPLGWPAWWGFAGAGALICLGAVAASWRFRAAAATTVERSEAFDESDLEPVAAFGSHARVMAPNEAGNPVLPGADPDVGKPAPRPTVVVEVYPVEPDLTARVEALVTLMGEVEFLASIGLQHGAAEALEQYLSRTLAPAPLAWLELMDLHLRQGESMAADAVWNRFAAQSPTSTADSQVGVLLDPADAGLEALPAVLARVQAAWSTPQATEQLAAELMAVDASAPVLSLAAGRELLWLLQVRLEMAAARPAPAPETAEAGDAFDRTLALSAADWARHLGAFDAAPRDEFAAVDIDLGLPGWIDEARASVRVAPAVAPPRPKPVLVTVEDDDDRADMFDAATGFERHRAAFRTDPMYR